MNGFSPTDRLLDRAFQLACFILGDREAALCVVTAALGKLQVAVTAQGKRLYYTPIGRRWSHRAQSNRSRNNISFDELHLLQRLIYIESEPYEIAFEQGNGSAHVNEEDLVIHFVKHLTKKTIKRNSFYVTLGLSRLLHSYTTAEAMDIYNAVIQDPERVKDDYYYRSRKGVLMQELKQRFGDLINICRGPRGEERFQADDNQHRFVELVRECLDFFTPWHTPCLIPSGVDPIRDGIPSFSALSHDDEDKVEVNRIHAVLHPDCFRRLTANLHFDAPETRLEIPRFFYSNDMNGNDSNSNRRNPPKLSEQELTSIKDKLDSDAARRKRAQAGLLRIIVDGSEHARIDLKETSGARFSLDKDAELIEVRSRDNAGEELLLASHLLASIEPGNRVRPMDTSIILEGGQKISIHTSPESGDPDTIVEITYRETSPFRAASLFVHQLAQSLRPGATQSLWNDRRMLVPTLAFLVLLIFSGVVIRYTWKQNRRAIDYNQATGQQNAAVKEEENLVTQRTAKGNSNTSTAEKNVPRSPSTAPLQVAEAVQQKRERSKSPAENENTPRTSAQEKTAAVTDSEAVAKPEASTRSVTAVPAAVPLSAVRKVYIEIVGDEMLALSVREMLADRLHASNRISLARDRDEADALLKVTVTKGGGSEPGTAKAELINARGSVMWPNTKSGEKYQGSPADVSTGIIRDLLFAIQKSAKQR